MPIADLPGIGLRMRTSAEATAYAMFLESAVTRSTLVAGPSSTSYRVTVGPRVNPVTWASISNCSKTIDSASTTRSLATLRVRWGAPGRRRAWSGRVYATSPVRDSCSTREGRVEVGGGTSASLGPSPGWGAVFSVALVPLAGTSSGAGRFSPGRSRRPRPVGTTTAACSNASSPSRFSSRSTARRRGRGVGVPAVAASSASSSSAPWRTRSRRSRNRWGIWRTGVPVTTSAPNRARSTSSAMVPGRDTADASGLEARNPMMPAGGAHRVGAVRGVRDAVGDVGEPAGGEGQRHGADDEAVGDGLRPRLGGGGRRK